MSTTPASQRRLPKSVRKHLRRAKAELRRNEKPADAEKAIEQLVKRIRRGSATTAPPK